VTPIYFDHNASTPVDPIVLEAMLPFFTLTFGNPSSVVHAHGHNAAEAVEIARSQVAAALGARAEEIVFTSGCTEANNLAILGVADRDTAKKHFITSNIEHPSVLEPLSYLEEKGHDVTYLRVDEVGRVDPRHVEEALRENTALVSVMGANNEVGTRQNLAAIGAICERANVLFHTDLAQTVAYGDVDVGRDSIHLASISGHKAYGPKGIGALYIRSRGPRVKLKPRVFGGGQERGLRSGTLNVPGIVGLGIALGLTRKRGQEDAKRLRKLGNHLREIIRKDVDDVVFNGDEDNRIANNISISIKNVDPHALIRALQGVVSFSASSACATNSVVTSHVLKSLYGDDWRARNAFRLGLGRWTTIEEVERVAIAIGAEAGRIRGRFAPTVGV
jgi:cysteine desulfurase